MPKTFEVARNLYVQARTVGLSIGKHEKIRYFCVDEAAGIELLPYFETRETAQEICDLAAEGRQGFTNIAAVPYGSPVPRDGKQVNK